MQQFAFFGRGKMRGKAQIRRSETQPESLGDLESALVVVEHGQCLAYIARFDGVLSRHRSGAQQVEQFDGEAWRERRCLDGFDLQADGSQHVHGLGLQLAGQPGFCRCQVVKGLGDVLAWFGQC